jgi:uncharacterized membrane protein (DUF2068 family)
MTNLDPTPAPPASGKAAQPRDSGLKLIAVLKIAKAVLITGLAVGFFRAIDADLGETLRNLTVKLRIDPENHLIRLALEKLKLINPKQFHTFGVLSLFYASELYIEGIGLWFNQAWAKYLVVIATGFFIPEEGYACIHHFSWGRFSIHLLNIAVLIYVIIVLCRKKERNRSSGEPWGAAAPPN